MRDTECAAMCSGVQAAVRHSAPGLWACISGLPLLRGGGTGDPQAEGAFLCADWRGSQGISL